MTSDTRVGQGTMPKLLGTPARHGDLTFQAIAVPVEGETIELPLSDFAGQPLPAVLQLAFEKQYDAAWVRARLPRVFAFTPVFVEELESALLDVAMLATPEGEGEPVVFACADHHGRAGLRFGTVVDRAMKERIARAFWSLMLTQPENLADFEQMVYHEPTDVWLKMGCLHGKLYCEAMED